MRFIQLLESVNHDKGRKKSERIFEVSHSVKDSTKLFKKQKLRTVFLAQVRWKIHAVLPTASFCLVSVSQGRSTLNGL